MKNLKRLIVLLVVLSSFSTTSKASHVLGGEMGWTCLANGKYIFYMTTYRDCTGIPFNYTNETITVVGFPLPKDASGNPFSTIALEPDSNRWIAEDNGDTSPSCTNQYGTPNTCANRDPGTVQQFFYKSDPITLGGNPNRAGWKFYWESVCCRPGAVENVQTNGTMLLRAEMYRTKDLDDKDPCIDSSPRFRSLPTTSICRGYEFTYNSTAIDSDLDSLIYSWDRPYNPPYEAPVALQYNTGYSPDNPTPDESFDVKNIASTLNPLSGVIKMAVYSGTGTDKFITVIQVDSYRDGVKIATVYREIPVSVFNCPTLPNGKKNNPPEVFIDGVSAEGIVVDVTAGQEVRIPIQVKDLDVTGIGTQLQNVTMVPDGLLFSRDRATATPCQVTFGAGQNLVVEPCAYMRNKTPFLDNQSTPPERKITGLSGLSTEFIWQTACAHIQTKTGVPGTNEGVYNFVLRVSDDHCPVPAINYPTITVRVKDPVPLKDPIMKGISVGLDGKITYQWVPALDSAFTFEKYLVEEQKTVDGIPVAGNSWNPFIPGDQRLYQQDYKSQLYAMFRYKNNNPAEGFDILKKIPNRDWYLRMIAVSGCTDDVQSEPSVPVRVMELKTTPVGPAPDPIKSEVKVEWNRPKSANAKTYPYFYYESDTRFYLWENDSISNGEVDQLENWYLRGSTTNTEFTVASNVCQDYVGFRVEARDTVITWRQGNAPSKRTDSLDTLVFSTFSIVDTAYMVTPGRIPRPKLDTIEVKANGDIYIRGDRAAAGTAGTFNLFNTAVDPDSLLASMDLEIEDSVLIAGQNADNKMRSIIIEAIDRCNLTVRRNSFVYTTILPEGDLVNTCPPIYRLTWNEPTGFNTAIKGYQVFADTTGVGNNFVQVGSTDGTTTSFDIPVLGGKIYSFRVIATDNEDAVNMSAILTDTIDNNLRTDFIPDPPELRCTFVEDNGDVTISFAPPAVDDDENGTTYDIQFRRNGGAWQNFPNTVVYDPIKSDGDQGDTAATITGTGFDAQTARYDFRFAINGDCDGTTPSPWSNVISTIFIEATAKVNDIDKTGDVAWNSTQVDYGSNVYSLFKDTFNLRYNAGPLNPFVDSLGYLDETNDTICFGAFNYYVTIEDEFSKCISRSNIDSTLYQDNFPPKPLKLNYISFNNATNGLVAYWTVEPGDTDSLFFTSTDGFNSGQQAYKAIGETKYDDGSGQFGQYGIPFTVLDARDSAVVVGAIAQDGCGNRSSEEDIDFHKSMDVEVQWNVCDSSMQITWNPYEGFDENFDVSYIIVWDTTGNNGGFQNNPALIAGTDTTFNHKIEEGDKVYRYQVRASSTDPAAAAFESNSNIDSDLAIYEDEPRYGYLTFATVEDRVVKLEYNKDTLINVKGYNIFRGTDKNLMNRIGYVDFQTVKDDEFIEYTDANVDVSSFSYFYKIEVQNACDEPVDTSNLGRSILLRVNPDNEALTNTLTWNEYVEWDSTVAYYNIYRGVDAEPTANVFDVVPPSNGEFNLFVDDVYDELFSIGKFCYRVEAVQGQVTDAATDGFPNNLSPATSNSNVVCITQEPLFYVPNAFAPDGVNKMFGPKGQFFDFSLFEMVIFNRWGEEVYRTRDINKGWDGTYNGEIAQLGSYVYTIRFIDADGDEHRRKGTVTLIK